MHCRFCGFNNGDDDHRCLRCGRRIGMAIAAPTSYSGANALAPVFETNETHDFLPLPESLPSQPALFTGTGPKVIPFETHRQKTGKLPVLAPPVAQGKAARPPAKSDRRQPNASPVEQASLDFLNAPLAQRVLKTEVPAQIYCNRPVATPTHRFVAGSMDTAMVLMGFGIFVGITELLGGGFGTGKLFWVMMALAFALIAAFYGFAFALIGTETAGMFWTDLQLITFDGFPVDGRSRAARFASTWLSFCSGGLGLVWALADEETLTWQDHISKTFPTVKETSSGFVRR
jgi:uncharacterized RDD family membrane protein YckC